MNPFGNIDEPEAPDWYQPGQPKWLRTALWYIRNPLHNFTHYMVGVADKPFSVTYWGPAVAGFNRDGGWLFALIQPEGWQLALPYVSYVGQNIAFYVGWHPSRGKLAARISKSA